jgi:predicted dithiol-disulfide oxidoreductase (DUF899 family)
MLRTAKRVCWICSRGRASSFLYHFMYHARENHFCDGCSFFADQVCHLAHLHARDTLFAMVARAPIAKITAFKKPMGWTVPWASSFDSDFMTTAE